jgi:hypothetical protein
MQKAMQPKWIWIALAIAGPAYGQDLVSQANLGDLGYYKYWQAEVPLFAGDRIDQIHRVGESVYAVTHDARVYALHADIGTLRWSCSPSGISDKVYAPTHATGRWGQALTLLTTSRGVQVRDRATGAIVLDLELSLIPSASAVCDGMRIFVPGLDGFMNCFEFAIVKNRIGVVKKWRVETQGRITARGTLWGGGLFFPSEGGRVRAGVASQKDRLWVFNARSPISSPVTVDSTGVFFTTYDRSIYRLDLDSGRLMWRHRTPAELKDSPVLIGEQVFQYLPGTGLRAVDLDTGLEEWTHSDGVAVISSTPQVVHLLDRSGRIQALDLNDGRVQKSAVATDVELVSTNVASSAMYLANRHGRIMCAQEKHVPFLRFEDVASRVRPQSSQSSADLGTDTATSGNRPRADLRSLLSSDAPSLFDE